MCIRDRPGTARSPASATRLQCAGCRTGACAGASATDPRSDPEPDPVPVPDENRQGRHARSKRSSAKALPAKKPPLALTDHEATLTFRPRFGQCKRWHLRRTRCSAGALPAANFCEPRVILTLRRGCSGFQEGSRSRARSLLVHRKRRGGRCNESVFHRDSHRDNTGVSSLKLGSDGDW